MALQVDIDLGETFDETQLASLREAAENCRISRALNVPVTLRLRSDPARSGASA